MDAWFVRDRGRELGPYSLGQLRQLREGRQLPGYVEVSRDRVSWQPIDLVVQPAPPPSSQTPSEPVPVSRSSEDGGGFRWPKTQTPSFRGMTTQRTIALAVGGATLFVASLALGIVLVRNRNSDATSRSTANETKSDRIHAIATGPISLGAKVADEDRDRLFKECVGLVIPGRKFTTATGEELESRYFEGVAGKNGRVSLSGGSGSGFVISPTGHILTNQHVVEQADNYNRSLLKDLFEKNVSKHTVLAWVFFGKDQKYEASFVHVSKHFDLAILKIDKATPRFFALSSTPPPEIPNLERLYAVGFPGKDRDPLTRKESREAEDRKGVSFPSVEMEFGDADFEVSKRTGDINKAAQKRQMGPRSNDESYVFLHSAQIYGGNSGGPLVGPGGTVLGINTWTKKDETGFNFAQCLPDLRKEIDEHVPGVVWRPYKE